MMTKDQSHAIALMRYSLIAPLISGLSDQYESKEAFFRDVSAKGVSTPNGTIKHFAPTSIKRWYNNYQRGGFDALMPSSRSDNGKSRKLDEHLREQINYLKSNDPRMSSAAIFRQLRETGSIRPGELSEATVNRFVQNLAIQQKTTTNEGIAAFHLPEGRYTLRVEYRGESHWTEPIEVVNDTRATMRINTSSVPGGCGAP